MSDTDDKKIELWVVKDLRIGDVIQASYPGYPVLGTTPCVPLFLTCQDQTTGEMVKLKLALSIEQVQYLATETASLVDKQKFGSGGSSVH